MNGDGPVHCQHCPLSNWFLTLHISFTTDAANWSFRNDCHMRITGRHGVFPVSEKNLHNLRKSEIVTEIVLRYCDRSQSGSVRRTYWQSCYTRSRSIAYRVIERFAYRIWSQQPFPIFKKCCVHMNTSVICTVSPFLWRCRKSKYWEWFSLMVTLVLYITLSNNVKRPRII